MHNRVSSFVCICAVFSCHLSCLRRRLKKPGARFHTLKTNEARFKRRASTSKARAEARAPQISHQHCNYYIHALIAPSKLHRNLQVATISILISLLISIFSWQIFADKNIANIGGGGGGGDRTPDLTVNFSVRRRTWKKRDTGNQP